MSRTPLHVLALTRYGPLGASSRVRMYQFVPALRGLGVDVTAVPLLGDAYVARRYRGASAGGAFLLRAYAARFREALRGRRFGAVWVEKELLPFAPAWLESLLLSGMPVVVDYDDATFHTYDLHPSRAVRALWGHKIDRLMRRADLVVAGNPYIASRAAASGARRVDILPSVVDLKRYGPVAPEPAGPFTVGWIGSPGSEAVLEPFRDMAVKLASAPDTRVVLVGASERALPGVRHETWPWSEDTEVRDMQRFHVGIMPLSDTPWERGKCAFKLIQYMAAGRPVVASPVGANAEVVADGVSGFLASGPDEWAEHLGRLRSDPALRARMGEEGRRRVESTYSLGEAAPRLATLLRSVSR